MDGILYTLYTMQDEGLIFRLWVLFWSMWVLPLLGAAMLLWMAARGGIRPSHRVEALALLVTIPPLLWDTRLVFYLNIGFFPSTWGTIASCALMLAFTLRIALWPGARTLPVGTDSQFVSADSVTKETL